jgi:membrane protein DedA with SNARE-associated domain
VTSVPDPTQLLENAAHLGAWVYAIVGVLAFLETAMVLGLLVPGELAVILGGGLAAAGAVDLVALSAVVWGAAVAGDTTSYAIGRRLGPRVRGSRVGRGRAEQIDRVAAILHRRGAAIVVGGRFVGLLRALVPLAAGSTAMPARRFVAADVVGAGLWAVGCCGLGYVFAAHLDELERVLRGGQYAAVAVMVAVAAGWWIVKRRRAAARAADVD